MGADPHPHPRAITRTNRRIAAAAAAIAALGARVPAGDRVGISRGATWTVEAVLLLRHGRIQRDAHR